MIKRFSRWHYSLSMQMVILLTGLIFLTALAVGIPALWIIRDQLERQSWALVEQGSQTSQALLAKRTADLRNLAILTAQRPTLLRLVEQDDRAELLPYLATLREGAAVDALLLCGADGSALLRVGAAVGEGICRSESDTYIDRENASPAAWLAAAYPLPGELDTRVLLALRLDDAFAAQLQAGSGMEHILLVDGAYAASSFTEGDGLWRSAAPVLANAQERYPFTHQGAAYNMVRSGPPGEVTWLVALPVTDLLAARQQVTLAVAGGIAFVILLGTALGVLRTRRISRPLERLRDAAEDLRRGELSRPVAIESRIREVAMLSYALDDARIALNHSLTELRQERDWSEHILKSVVEGIVTIDRRKRITFFSHGAENITGLQERQVLDRPIDEVFQLADEDTPFSQRMPAAGSRQKITVRLGSGQPATLAVTGAELVPPETGRAGLALVLRDVSSEEAIRRLLGDFLANITHEFRTPLSALAASIELLLDQLPDLQPDELRELLDNIHLGTLSLQNLIDNLLEGASIETGRFRVSTAACRVEDIASEAARLVAPLVEKYGLSLRVVCLEQLPPVQADFRRTTQVVVNLLSNAVKWSPPGGEIVVSILPGDERVTVHVSDQGPGVDPDLLPGLFHRFRTRASRGGAEGGAGLGLSVVKAIVEAQGGQVGVTNRPGGGSDFWFTLRRAGGDGFAEEAL